ncbi:MAG TPA: polyphosphate kinase 2 [Steroidobacteraceae bacterium]|nr:polyphosphate kinase 2 [Gammaproteobacteria bacterium]HEV2285282.1 polyphosphate kinase 2 [Steroidobacteraceae bacterium]
MTTKKPALSAAPPLGKHRYARELRQLQIELVKLHRHVIARGRKVLVILEGRDAAGKDGTIKRIAEHLSPRETRVVAPGRPSDREQTEWYFQRFTGQLPAAQEIVLFNRSWYNRAGVEVVMKFCTRAQSEEFLEAAPGFEGMLVRSGIHLLKYYLDISHDEQARRLRARGRDPLKQWKLSPVDEAAQRHWHDYSRARDRMLLRTHSEHSPWMVVRADDKQQARLNVIRDILARVPAPGVSRRLARPDPRVVREFDAQLLESGWVAR